MLNDLRMFARYAWGLNRYLSHPLTPEECYLRLNRQLGARDESFLLIVDRGIYANPRSPYLKLLQHVGLEFADIVRLVRQVGIQGTLARLYESGIFIQLDEFKGRKPIQRAGLQFSVSQQDFDNPLLARHYEARTGGSRGLGSRLIIDFDLLTHEAAYHFLFRSAHRMTNNPIAIWFPIPPGVGGLKVALWYAKLGKFAERWFTQTPLSKWPGSLKHFLFTKYTIYTSRLFGRPLPIPEYTPLEEAFKVASWLANMKKRGTPGELHTNPSSGVRVCLAAKAHGLDIQGAFFHFYSEPYTPAKAQVIEETGSRAVCHYNMAEIGQIGIACASPVAIDDVHLLTDKIAVIQRPKSVGISGLSVASLVYTTLLPSCPRLMLNVESDDYGILEDRDCGCSIGEIGFSKHLSNIRSYEKLTSEGVTFLGTELMRLIEEVLPARFGGSPTDYQLVEEEEGVFSKVSIIVDPRVGDISEEEVVATVLKVLSSYPGGVVMTDKWRQGQTLKVVRRAPYATSSSKILPLHILQNDYNA